MQLFSGIKLAVDIRLKQLDRKVRDPFELAAFEAPSSSSSLPANIEEKLKNMTEEEKRDFIISTLSKKKYHDLAR